MRAVAPAVLRHRIVTNFNAEAEGVKPDRIVADLMAHVPAEVGEDAWRAPTDGRARRCSTRGSWRDWVASTWWRGSSSRASSPGLHKSPYHGFSVEFAEHRQYMPGDPLRSIDWKVYAKTDRFYVKQYEDETNLRAHLVLDHSASMDWTSTPGGITKLEYARTLAAALAYLMLGQQDAVGLLTFDETIETATSRRARSARTSTSSCASSSAHAARRPHRARRRRCTTWPSASAAAASCSCSRTSWRRPTRCSRASRTSATASTR